MIELWDIVIFGLLAWAAAWWWRGSGEKARALREARRLCERRGLQLLDQTLAFARYRLEKDGRGRTVLCRHYEFDFCSDGLNRRTGLVVMAAGTRLRAVLDDGSAEVIEY